MLRRFASIQNPETVAYAFDSENWSSNAPIHTSFRAYQTYGDGICQHSGDWSVTTEQFADFMFSLSAAMLADEELTNHLSFTIARRPAVADIAFAASIKFVAAEGSEMFEKKTRYYSISERKISTSAAKEHDKRYERITASEDGSAAAIFRMLLPDYAGGLERYQYATAIGDWLQSQENGAYMELPGEFLQWATYEKDGSNYRDKAREMRNAFECALHVVEAYRLRSAAESALASGFCYEQVTEGSA